MIIRLLNPKRTRKEFQGRCSASMAFANMPRRQSALLTKATWRAWGLQSSVHCSPRSTYLHLFRKAWAISEENFSDEEIVNRASHPSTPYDHPEAMNLVMRLFWLGRLGHRKFFAMPDLRWHIWLQTFPETSFVHVGVWNWRCRLPQGGVDISGYRFFSVNPLVSWVARPASQWAQHKFSRSFLII